MAGEHELTVVGVFHDRPTAQQAVDDLRAAGFAEDDIGYAMRDGEAAEGSSSRIDGDGGTGTGSGAVAGMLTGGVVGGIAAAAVSLLVPGVGPVIGGGILATVLGGAAAGAAAGGVLGALVGMGVPEEEARYYEQEFSAGRAIVTVQAGARYREAAEILGRHGGHDAERRAAARSMGEARAQAYAAHPESTALRETATHQGATAAGSDAGSVAGLHASGDRASSRIDDNAESSYIDAVRETVDTHPQGTIRHDSEGRNTGMTERIDTRPSVPSRLRQEALSGEQPETSAEADTQELPRPNGSVSIGDEPPSVLPAERSSAAATTGSGAGMDSRAPEHAEMPAGHSAPWPVRTDDAIAGKYVEGEEAISTTMRGDGGETLIVSPTGHARARDAAEASGPYIDPSEDLERVGATSGLAPRQAENWHSAERRYRERWQSSAPTGASWEDVAEGYHFGHDTAASARYQDRSWRECEPELQREFQNWQRSQGREDRTDGWQRVRASVRDAWQAGGRS